MGCVYRRTRKDPKTGEKKEGSIFWIWYFKDGSPIFESSENEDESRLAAGFNPQPGHPAKQRRQLTTVAHPERKGVGTAVEGIEHLFEPRIEPDDAGPSLRAVQNIRVGESSDKNNPSEAVQRDFTAEQV